ncbi:HEAT repeat domain-containing protein [Streptomyces roseicoloratus]|uniref:HEAT repeat domain-containing protein n=1 Tax=Streptomyces roseicoloratus TaxID=2508722 RepID=UPI001009BD30|nr:HEAT repeat domain-containing protein [Streptomyces roseicoloratus]
MATFVHLTPAAYTARIRRNGVRAAGHGRGTVNAGVRGVYVFPVLPSYTLTHQWLRELGRRPGPRGLVAVHVRLPDGEPVTVGRYSDREPVRTTAAEAVRRIGALEDARGWEVFLPRPVARGEVRQIRPVRQVHGWRYFPDAHGVTPCTCDGCRVRGEYGSRRLRARRPHPLDGPPPAPRILLDRLDQAESRDDRAALREILHWYGLRRRGPLSRLATLAGHPDPIVRTALAEAVAGWSTPGVDALLRQSAGDGTPEVRRAVAAHAAYREPAEATALLTILAADPSPAVREAAADSLAELDTPEAASLLAHLANDPAPAVREAVAAYLDE